MSWSRSIEWRNARDNPAPEIPPATRSNGPNVGLRAGSLPDCKWGKALNCKTTQANGAVCVQADQDTVYEQDLLRSPGSIKPWLAYIEYKQQHGTLYEQAFVRFLCRRDDVPYTC